MRTHLRITAASLAVMAAIVVAAMAADTVEPASCTVTNLRNESEALLSSEQYFIGSTLLLTNCFLGSGETVAAGTQGLDGVTIEAVVGTTVTSTTNTGTVISTNEGTWWTSFTVPNQTAPYLQVTVTDSATNSYIYPWKQIQTKTSL